MTMVSREALILLESKCESHKPATLPDGVTPNDPFPTGLRYIINVFDPAGYKGGYWQDKAKDPGESCYTYDVVTINIDDGEIEEANSGHRAYRESDGVIVLLESKFWKDEDT